MGCFSSKQAVSIKPALDSSGSLRDNGSVILSSSRRNRAGLESEKKKIDTGDGGDELGESKSGISKGVESSFSLRLESLQKYVEGEQVAAGWPCWLSAVAKEAIQGWVPLRADSFEKLEKIGQGTYSSVFRARELDTGKIVALKKVRFDNFEPESVRFMAREIMILRRLDHPNIVKLEGLITSRLSCSIYLVFEYMEHDLAGLSSCPDIKFSESQVKCYMRQLFSGLEHCHSRGIMHRDVKGSNLLVNNEGIVKIADFGLANFCSSRHRQPLTSRVVTLWYRPPELLLGSTNYGASVDLWSVGCVFAELLIGKPILQGRTEVEQLHKIFKLCGSPPDEYWKKSKLPHATIFKPQHPYESCLQATLKDFPTTVVNLIENLLAVEPYKRVTASSALASEYFTTKPYACDPSSLPKYPPNKEIDAKSREDMRRKKAGGRVRGSEGKRKPTRISKALRETNFNRLAPVQELQGNKLGAHKSNRNIAHVPKEDKDAKLCADLPKPSIHTMQEPSHIKNASQGDVPFSGPLHGDARLCADQSRTSNNMAQEPSHIKNASQGDFPFSGPLHMASLSSFVWAKRQKEYAESTRSHNRSSSRGQISNALEPSEGLKDTSNSGRQENGDVLHEDRTDFKGNDSHEMSRHALQKQWSQFDNPDSFDASDAYFSQELSASLYLKEELADKKNNRDRGDRVDLSGPLLSQSNGVEELLERNERHIRQAARRSWFQRGKKLGK
ncbi:protein IMPAIRED IN BABA-INDUCED STERILITY 1-like isoform X2 [Macadamia integrifolia]|uniref:protein IMPAIRED IN BABA-INDUCED STERILITY 1-like isoform X2 n=1 Tax=Macadamia integrifolia TaxID=60698 RepID=UPI001C4E2FBC|nr:protein IMPAIRED IN BABA-INDUCED STERILITY 1-like isoform X2 [Macadamia integrifolia]